MGSFSIWHLLVVVAVIVLLFGRGKISSLMGDVAEGIKSFKKGMKEEEQPSADIVPPKSLNAANTEHGPTTSEKRDTAAHG